MVTRSRLAPIVWKGPFTAAFKKKLLECRLKCRHAHGENCRICPPGNQWGATSCFSDFSRNTSNARLALTTSQAAVSKPVNSGSRQHWQSKPGISTWLNMIGIHPPNANDIFRCKLPDEVANIPVRSRNQTREKLQISGRVNGHSLAKQPIQIGSR